MVGTHHLRDGQSFESVLSLQQCNLKSSDSSGGKNGGEEAEVSRMNSIVAFTICCACMFSSPRRKRGAVHPGPGEVWRELRVQRRSRPGLGLPQVLRLHQGAHRTLQKPCESTGGARLSGAD